MPRNRTMDGSHFPATAAEWGRSRRRGVWRTFLIKESFYQKGQIQEWEARRSMGTQTVNLLAHAAPGGGSETGPSCSRSHTQDLHPAAENRSAGRSHG